MLDGKVPRARRRTNVIVGIGVLGASLAVVALLGFFNRSRETNFPSVRIVPFTSFPGQEVAPSFSPDGSEIAFAWKSDTDTGFDLYVKTIGSERVLRLTHHSARWISPAWSPDGTQIAFSRWTEGDSGVYLIPALGGPERKLANATFWYEPFMQVSWSPDGKSLAFWSTGEGRSQVFLLSLDTLRTQTLNHDANCWDVGAPAISPDGKFLAAVCTTSIAVYKILAVPLSGGPSRLVAAMMGYPLGFAWAEDSNHIIFSNDSGAGGELWLANLNGNLTRLPFGEQGFGPAFAPKSHRLAYARGSKTINIWRIDLMARSSAESAKKLISSTRMQRVPQYSPDGTKIVFESNRSGTHEIWLADADGSNPVQITSSNGALTGAPSWCSDGQRIAFDSRVSGSSAIYVESIGERVPQRVQTNVPNLAIPAWSGDCRWLFASDGHDMLYRLPSRGGNAVRVTDRSSWYSVVNGDRLFFNVKEPTGVRLWSRPTGDGDEAPLPNMPELGYAESWTVTSKGAYYTDSATNPPTINFYDFAKQSTKPLLSLRRRPTPNDGLAVSPDGRWLLYTQTDDEQSDIMLVEHFQ
jgi:Tol biopolymer transport system component